MNSARVIIYANLNYFLCLKTTCRLATPTWTALFCRAIQVASQKVKPPHRCYLRRSRSKHFLQEPEIKTHLSSNPALSLARIY